MSMETELQLSRKLLEAREELEKLRAEMKDYDGFKRLQEALAETIEDRNETQRKLMAEIERRRTDTEKLQAEIRRLKTGDFNPNEFQNLCHYLGRNNKPGCTAQEFAEGCRVYNKELFGTDLTPPATPWSSVLPVGARLGYIFYKGEVHPALFGDKGISYREGYMGWRSGLEGVMYSAVTQQPPPVAQAAAPVVMPEKAWRTDWHNLPQERADGWVLKREDGELKCYEVQFNLQAKEHYYKKDPRGGLMTMFMPGASTPYEYFALKPDVTPPPIPK